jgi:glycogen operon protein
VEGPADDPQITALRLRQAKNAFALLMLSQGPPMIYEGDEMGRSKNGNNNSYCQDNNVNWLDWSLLEKNAGLFRFVSGMIDFRKNHPSLGRADYFEGKLIPGADVLDVQWHGVKPGLPDWSPEARSLAFTIGGPWSEEGGRQPDIYAAFHAGDVEMEFELPKVSGRRWLRKVYTFLPTPEDYLENGHEEELLAGELFTLAPKSCVVLVTVDNL